MKSSSATMRQSHRITFDRFCQGKADVLQFPPLQALFPSRTSRANPFCRMRGEAFPSPAF